MKQIMKEFLIAKLQEIAKNKTVFIFETSEGAASTYDDSNGQRHCVLEHFGYGKENKKIYPAVFKIKRKLAFENQEDKGKEGAVLLIIRPEKARAESIAISNGAVEFGGIKLLLKS